MGRGGGGRGEGGWGKGRERDRGGEKGKVEERNNRGFAVHFQFVYLMKTSLYNPENHFQQAKYFWFSGGYTSIKAVKYRCQAALPGALSTVS